MDFTVRCLKYWHEPQNVWETSKNFSTQTSHKVTGVRRRKRTQRTAHKRKSTTYFQKLSEYDYKGIHYVQEKRRQSL